ncbi:MFS transporter [Litchfieldella xinjiangensis]|uniref:MFS transporter n=1 Tax=Litchfieldella xinjiangensis TaxID=1166948 RepID=UPI000693DA59|nr:MFS transporter [Halomonas xinjiangensis]
MLRFADSSQRRVTLFYFLLFIGVGMTGGLLGPALPHFAAMTGSTMSEIAILFTFRALGNIGGGFITGMLMDRYAGHRVLMGMALMTAGGLLIAPYSPTLGMLAVMMFLLGFSEVSMNAGGNTLMLWSHRRSAAPFVSVLHFFFGLGNVLVPLVMLAAIVFTGQFRWTFWVVAFYLVLLTWPLSRLQSPSMPQTEGHPGVLPTKRRDNLLLGMFMLLFALYVGIEVTFAGWITAYGVLQDMPPEDAGLLVSLFWLMLSLGRLLAVPALRWWSPWKLLNASLGLGLITAIGLYGMVMPLPMAAVLFGLAASAFFPTLFSLANLSVAMTGRYTGMVFMAAGLGAMVVPSVAGPLLELAGAQALPLLLASMLLLLGAGLYCLRLRLSHGNPHTPHEGYQA